MRENLSTGSRRKVLIVGAGALGKSLAALLSIRADVILYGRNSLIRQQLSNKTFSVIEKSDTKKVKVRMVDSLGSLKNEKIDVLILATKINDLQLAVKEARGLKPQCIFLPQNGIFRYDWAKVSLKGANICRGVTTMACQENGHNQVSLYYRGNMYVGGDGAVMVANLFRKCGVKVKTYRDPSGPVWAKLIFSAVMNPLPVITEKGYDILRLDRDVWKLVKQAIEEGRDVARALGVRLAFDPMQIIDRVRNGDLTDIEHRGSIVHDMRAGRSTELDFITGALIRQARKVGVKTPALDLILMKAKLAGA